ncbi:NADH-quinone oxidoreductase subunit M [Actinospica durhamensis]|uniref:NADH-quinone oxidoreductase subunit M n=1 Tax=Actinospica durhamensis TaxID=1508375 RepID=A0A941EK88_9ACTN|nr:NADH-quinone oxidoreductase subunit M [Actinospica durhamensis]MBR7832057.1 NADH-quinone oxidoreductase subunit M [Actinospica durhamensis]
MSAILLLLLLVPAAGLLALYAAPAALAARIGTAAGTVTFVLSLVLLPLFDYSKGASFQGQIDLSWISALDLHFHLGIDGVSLPLLLLTTLLTALCLFYAQRTSAGGDRARPFTALLLALEIGMVGTFEALDLLLFFVFFELVLIPMYGLISHWGSDAANGGATRQQAATKFILYTLLGSALMLLGFLVIHAKTGTFDMVTLQAEHGLGMTRAAQGLAFVLVGIGFGIKTPMWPLHTWLPDAHTSAPTVGSVLLAGVLLKMGTYGFIRVGAGMIPAGLHQYAIALGALGVVGIVYGSLACVAQIREGGDLKRLIAYSSVGHMGFTLLGIATMTQIGLDAALFASVAHGLITGLLFFLVGGLKTRYGTTDLYALGRGLYGRARRFGALLVFTAIASLGLPGLAGFWGELFALIGADRPAPGLNVTVFHLYMAVAGLGMVLTAAYLLLVVRRVCMGELTEPCLGDYDLKPYELASWLPLAGLTLLAGLWPAVVLAVADPAVNHVIGTVTAIGARR